MTETILNIAPYVLGLLALLGIYLKGYKDKGDKTKADMVDTLKKYRDIDKEKVDKDDAYKSSNW